MKAFASALVFAVAFALVGTTASVACGGMTTVNPPPLTIDDPVAPPTFNENDDLFLNEGECIL
jgi:hypothetical protein